VSDQVALIKNGNIIAWGSPEEVLDGENIRDLYEMERVRYDRVLGTIEMRYSEIKPEPGKNVFCIAGSGSGAVLYRSLLKAGFDISTGIIHENDIDFHVAGSLGIKVVGAPVCERITEKMLKECDDFIRRADFIIDTGFALGELNRLNIELIKRASQQRKEIYTLRPVDELKSLSIDGAEEIVPVKSDYEVIKALHNSDSLVIRNV
jgi:iron complex transport system ATP-binding protein